MAEASQKICQICKQDCSGRPRTKDARGRYYCQPCYDLEVERRQRAKAQADALQTPEADGPSSALLEALAAVPPAAGAVSASRCANCETGLMAGATICVNCGTPVGGAAAPKATKVKKAKRPKGPRTRDSVWPMPFGIISVLFGAVGVLVNGLAVLGNLLGADFSNTKQTLIDLGGSTLMFWMSVWLLIAGIGLLRRSDRAPALLLRWSIAKLILVGLLAVLAAVMLGNEESFRLAMIERGQDPAGIPPVAFFYGVLLGVAAWLALWPVVCLLWLIRPSVREDVASW